MPSSFKKKLTLNLLIAIGIISSLIGALVFFNNDLKKTSARVNNLNKDLISRSNDIRSVAELKSQYEKNAAPYLNVLYNVIPTKDELINFSKDIQNLASSKNLTFGFSFDGETNPSGAELGFVSFTVTVGGAPVSEITDFIDKFQKFRYLVKLESFSITGENPANAIMKGRVFFR